MCDAIAVLLQRYLVPLSMGLLAITVFFQVLNRFLLHIPLAWTEEIGRYMFVWTSMLAATSGIREKAHLNVELLQSYVGSKFRKVLLILSEVLSIGFFAALAFYGFYWVTRNGFQVRADSMRIPMFYIQVIIPAAASIMALFCLDALVDIIKLKGGKEGN